MASPVKNKQIIVASDFDINNNKLINVSNPDDNNDAVNLQYFNSGLTETTFKSTESIYVDFTEGNNDTGDGSPYKPYKTFQKAIDEAEPNEVVVSLGSEIIEETIICKNDVNIFAPNNILELGGSEERFLSLARGTVQFKKIVRFSGSNTMIIAEDSTIIPGYSILVSDEIRDEGNGVTIQNGLNRPLDLHLKQVYVGNNNIFLLDTIGSVAHTHIKIDDIYLSSSGCTGISLSNGGNVLGFIDHIKELDNGIGSSTAFNIINGEVNIIAPDARCETIANIEINGRLNFTSQNFEGEIINNGGQFSYFTASKVGKTSIGSNLEIELDTNAIRLPQLSGNTGAFLTIGTGGLLNFTTINVGASEWTDDTPNITTLPNNTNENTIYDLTVDQNVTAGSYQYQVTVNLAWWRTLTVRLKVNSVTINTQTFTGAGSPVITQSIPISPDFNNTLEDGDLVELTVQLSDGAGTNTIGTGGFLTVTKSGTEATAQWGGITGDLSDQVDLSTALSTITSNRISGDSSLSTTVSTESSVRQSTDTSLSTAISSETSIRSSADTSLASELDTHTHHQLHQPNGTNPFVYTDNGGNLIINGNIIQSGTTFTTDLETLRVANDYIILRSGATFGLGPEEYTGFQAKVYDGITDGRLVYDSGGTARVGDIGDEQPLATRIEDPSNGNFAYWDNDNSRLDFKILEYDDIIGEYWSGGTNYIFVKAKGNDIENATELRNAYDEAKTMSPSINNRVVVLAAPGNYNMESTLFNMDTQYIDLVSLDGNRSIVFNSLNSNGTINITGNDVFVKGVDVLDKEFIINTNLNNLHVENCKGDVNSFGGSKIASGTFINCEGGENSFGGNGTASGTFINCKGGLISFGGNQGNASGIFTNCEGGDYSFGGFGGNASGTFTNCEGSLFSFGGEFGVASGIFINCKGNNQSFGGFGGNVTGTFTNCEGGLNSFGGNGLLGGKLKFCTLTNGQFNLTNTNSNTALVFCIDGDYNTITFYGE